MNVITFLQNLPLRQLRLLSIGCAIFCTEVLVALMSWLFRHAITYDYLLTGLVASVIVSYMISGVMTQLLRNLTDNQLKLHTIIEAEPECVKLVARDGKLLQMNQAGLAMLEVEEAHQIIGRPVLGVILPAYRDAFSQLLVQVFEGLSGNLEFEMRGIKGTKRWLHSHAVPLRDNKGQIVAMLAVTRDITETKHAEQALRAAHRQTELLLNSMAEGVYGIDLQGRCTFVNHSFLRLLGYQEANEIIGRCIHEIIHHAHADGSPYAVKECQIDQVHKTHDPIHLTEEVFWRKDGTSLPVECWSHPLEDEGKIIGNIVTFVDISDRKHAEQQIRHLAFFDALTQLPNRRLLHDRLSQAMSTSHRTQRYFALMFLDLDNFKPLNDRYGHDVGDLLLIEVAQRINHCTRQMDTVARFGGDEFIVMIRELDQNSGISETQAKIVAEKIRFALSEPYLLKIQENGDAQVARQVQHQCTASIGVVLCKDHFQSQDNLLKWADMAMYQAKEVGGNTVRFYQDPPSTFES